jgi:hypothetical protein
MKAIRPAQFRRRMLQCWEAVRGPWAADPAARGWNGAMMRGRITGLGDGYLELGDRCGLNLSATVCALIHFGSERRGLCLKWRAYLDQWLIRVVVFPVG